MIAYVKSITTFDTLLVAEAIDWQAPTMSNDASEGSAVFADERVMGLEGNWLLLDGEIFYITEISPDTSSELITVKIGDAFSAFNRQHGGTSISQSTTGDFLYAIFYYNYKTQADAEYAMPYLNITNSDATPLIKPELESDKIYTASDYFRMCAKRGIRIAFSATNTALNVDISTRDLTPQNIFMGNGENQLASQSFSANTVSKVTVYKNGAQSTYYLQADGSAGTTAPSPRIKGRWRTIINDSADTTALDDARSVFYENTAVNKICFYSTRKLECNQPLRIRIKDKVYTLAVSLVQISSGDSRYYYEAGDMLVTLTSKVRALLKKN